jgi:hypothetical protein
MKRLVAMTLVFALSTQACSSSYQPARSPRVAIAHEGGQEVLVRDGRTYSMGIFGAGLEDAVSGNPEAEEHARAHRNLMIGGWACAGVAIGTAMGGLVLVTDRNFRDEHDVTIPLSLIIGSLVADVAAIVLLANAQPHKSDAINIYNDGVDASLAYRPGPPPMPPAPPMPPGPPPLAPPTSTPAAPSATSPAPTTPTPLPAPSTVPAPK